MKDIFDYLITTIIKLYDKLVDDLEKRPDSTIYSIVLIMIIFYFLAEMYVIYFKPNDHNDRNTQTSFVILGENYEFRSY